ncbi:TPA: hypothetical protein ACY362_001403 [Pasteurella multocida]|uniref:hypothetical protein n=1 Tax=Pasteurella multocida TaxID=747 RepID=UPI000519C04F|nr:hypothetical protein [Pasteurella multocida]ARB76674.1 hypothetical protein A6J57_10730 [Pasteurella multocida]MEB3470958.1 hypothetical protein [Pasteurella multocida]NMK15859.1 hypothetical protein [Pasteurella multocida]NMR23494.1 hypothetical protein [Pasteurella multocida]NMR61048.1 hypothetical protein [Pasteurella multocida]
MKAYISLFIILFCLYGCYIGEYDNGVPYIGIDWNSNKLDQRLSYKRANICWQRERKIAVLKRGNTLSDSIDSDIWHKCLHSEGKYSFVTDENYQ